MAVSKRLRHEVLRRDNFACRYCGAKAPQAKLQVDHVIPRRHGGTDDPWNLTAACADCNSGKSDGLPLNSIIRDVREDEATYQVSKGLRVIPCMYCSRPSQYEPDEDSEFPQCEVCNSAVCEAFEAGLGRRLGHDYA